MLTWGQIFWPHVTFQELDMLLRVNEDARTSIDHDVSNRTTPLCLACKYNREDLVTVLLHFGARPNKSSSHYNKRPLHFACDHSEGNLGVVRKLLEAQAEINVQDDDGNSALHIACMESNVPVVRLLVSHGADVNIADIDGETALIRACFANCIELIEYLLKCGSDPNISKGQAMEIAVRISSVEILKLLVQAGANMDQGDYMNQASEQDHIEMMKVLHNYGVDIERHNVLGMTPLHTACLSNHASSTTVQLLLQWGAKVNALSTMQETPLHYACTSQHMGKIRLLLAYNVNVNVCDSHHLSPMLMAFKSPNLSNLSLQIVILLLAAGAQLSMERISGLRSIISFLPNSVSKKELMRVLDQHISSPMALQWLCRSQIRSAVKSNIDQNVWALPVPPLLIRFLNFNDIVGDEPFT